MLPMFINDGALDGWGPLSVPTVLRLFIEYFNYLRITWVFSRNFQEESQGSLCFWIRGPKQNLRGPTKSKCLLLVFCYFDSRHVFFLGSSVPLSWLHVPWIQCPCFRSTEMSFCFVFVIFAQTYQSFDIQNAKRIISTDILSFFCIKERITCSVQTNFLSSKVYFTHNVLSILCIPGMHCLSFFASQIIFLRKISNILH